MDIRELNENQYVDLFGDSTVVQQTTAPTSFGMEEQVADIFSTTEESTSPLPGGAASETAGTDSTTETTTADIDILKETDRKEEPSSEFKDISGYYEARVKAGKFVPIEEDGEDGTKKQFIPKSFDDLDEVIDIQVGYKFDQHKKNVEQQIYQSKSPAWQAVLKYSELVDDPSEVLPFIQGVKTIESVEALDENDISGAEKIVRTRLEQRGDTEDVIEEHIEALKTTDKLISTAQKYKPLILNQEKQSLNRMVQEEKQREAEYNALVVEIRDNAIKAIEAPIFGKQKLKQEEKAMIYDMIGEPSQETKGYGIFTAIDTLFENRDFETLKQIALLVASKDSFLKYISTNAADKTAGDLQRKLRVSTDSRNSSGNEMADDVRPAISRSQYTKGGFGRS